MKFVSLWMASRRVWAARGLVSRRCWLLEEGGKQPTTAPRICGVVGDLVTWGGGVGAFAPCKAAANQWAGYGSLRRRYSTQQEQSPGKIVQVFLAQTGEGIADCELLRWVVDEGDYVEEFQLLCEVQSDKASVEITSRYQGRVTKVFFQPGDIVKVGETLVEIRLDGEECLTSAEGEDKEVLPDSSLRDEEEVDDVLREEGKVRCTPAVRQLARKHGIRLEDVSGTGDGGRITKEDVMKHVVQVQEPKLAASDMETGTEGSLDSSVEVVRAHALGEDVVTPIRGFRRAMAKAMAATTAVPHFYYMEEIKVDALMKLRENLKKEALDRGVKLTYLSFMIKALSIALYKYPIMNSTVDSDLSAIRTRASHNIGVAMASKLGLVVPNIKNVQQLSVLEIAKEISRLSQLASINQLSSDDVSGGTITVSNFGAIGGKSGCPLLNLPEVAIVGLGRIQKLPQFDEDGTMDVVSGLMVTWAADHRVIDGATISSFCSEWAKLIEGPEHFLLHVR